MIRRVLPVATRPDRLRQRGPVLGVGLFALIVGLVFLGPVLWRVDPAYLDLLARNAAPSPNHPLGTDELGRDILARVLAGGRISISVGLAAMVIAVGLGTAIGLPAGFYNRLDGPLMRLTDLFLALPLLPLLLVLVTLFRDSLTGLVGAQAGLFTLIVGAIGITSWMQTARIVRGEVLALKERDFVMAARSGGARDSRLITRHILPNVLSPIVVSATLGMANAIITESALSFLGLGFPPDFATWGRLLADATLYLQDYPGRAFWPGLAISLTVLSVNYIGDGLRDQLDPRTRART
ncbi:MAG: ABC transporter permease [Pseudomonadota bacterium]